MSIEAFLKQLAEQQIEFWLEGESLRYRAPKQALNPELLGRLKAQKQAIIDTLKAQAKTPFALTYGQRALWFLHQSALQSPAYNVAFTARILSALDTQVFEQAVLHLVARHDALRLCFSEQQGEPQQWIETQSRLDYQIIDASQWDDRQLDEQVKSYYEQPFRFSPEPDQNSPELENSPERLNGLIEKPPHHPPLLRVCLFKRHTQEHVLLLVFHHIIGDGWSLWLLLDELEKTYPALLAQQMPKLKPSPFGFKQFALQQLAHMETSAAEQDWQYWQAKFAQKPPLLNLPCKRPFPQRRSYCGASYPMRINKALLQQLRNLAKQQSVTLYVLLLASYQLLLHRYSGQSQLCIGTPVSGRDQECFSQVVGYFVNPLPLLSNYSSTEKLNVFIKNTAREILAAIEHQNFPLALVIERLKLDRDSSRPPLFQAAFVFQQLQKSQHLIDLSGTGNATASTEWAGLTLAPYSMTQQEGQFDLSLELMEAGDELIGALKFNSDVMDENDAQRLAQIYEELLVQLKDKIDAPLRQLELLGEDARNQIVTQWNATDYQYSQSEQELIPYLLSRQAKVSTARKALIFEQQSMTYAELEKRSNQLAHFLIQQGVSPESIVAVHMQRSLELVWTLLAIIKAGAAYLPLDPDYPQDRLSYMLENAGAEILLSGQIFAQRFEDYPGKNLIIEKLSNSLEEQPGTAPKINLQPDNLAYVIYTSGSTGLPKGVPNTHIALLNRILWMQRYFQLNAQDVVLQKTPYSFDVSVWEFFWPLICGATLVVAKPGGHKDSDYLVQLIQSQRVTTLHFVPSMLQIFLENPKLSECQSLQRIICSGEALPQDLQEQLAERLNCGLFNLYGPTEAAIDVSVYACAKAMASAYKTATVPIGKPIDNLTLYILDQQLQVQPIGVAGDLYIGGIGLARGYLHQAGLTAEKFIPNPFAQVSQAGQRLYATGDIAYYREDGNIEYLGRSDGQVKLRGLRIELGEIEAMLKRHSWVKDAVVVVNHANREKRLLAYLTLHHEVVDEADLQQDLRSFLREQLPEFMLPAAFMVLAQIPLSSNGKVDRKALPEMQYTALEASIVAPQTELEKELFEIWADILQHEQFGVLSDFFQVDGHSLLALRLVARLNQRYTAQVAIEDIFNHSSIQAQAALLSNQDSQTLAVEEKAWPTIEVHDAAEFPLSYSQERLWFVAQLENARSVYHIPIAFQLHGELSRSALQHSLNALLQRHHALRTAVLENNHHGNLTNCLKVMPFVPLAWQFFSADRVRQQGVNKLLEEALKESFELCQGQALKVLLLEQDEQQHTLVLVLHHLMADGWSVNILLQELSYLYQHYLAEPCAAKQTANIQSLPELTVQYGDFSRWQRELMTEGYYQQAEQHWLATLANVPTSLNLPHDKTRPREPSFKGAMQYATIPMQTKQVLLQLGQQNGTTPFMTLLAIFALLLARYSGQNEFMIGTPMANRRRSEVENLIGLFVNTVLMRIQIKEKDLFAQLLQQIRQTAINAYQYQHYPFERLVEQLQPQRDLAVNPLFQAMYVYQEQPVQEFELSCLDVEAIQLPSNTAKCDLSLYVTEQTDGWLLGMEYSTDLFATDSIQGMLQSFCQLAQQLAAGNRSPVAQIPLLSTARREQMLTAWNATEHSYAVDLVPELLHRQSQQSPQQKALIFQDQVLNYAQLEQRSNQLAHYLLSQGIGPEALVAVSMQRSIELVVSLLAVIKAGAAYLPLDPDYPQQRLAYMLTDAGTDVLLSQAHLQSRFESFNGKIIIPAEESQIATCATTAPKLNLYPDNLAYVIYTSGSTGLPKGVPNTHAALLNRILWMQRHFNLDANDVVIQKTPYSFDVSVWEFFWPLLTGASLLVADPGGHKDPEYLADLIQAQQVSTIHFVPSMLSAFMMEPKVAKCHSLKHLICSGEALAPDLVDQVHQQLNISVHNLYGPTEAAIDVSVWECKPASYFKNLSGSGVPIGRPIDNLQLFILDPYLQPVPIAVPGNLYIAGAGLARGYFNQAALTAQKFIPNPFAHGERMYDTGDIARFMPDGVIDYLGRRDGQVKIRGLRIELGEIESVIKQQPMIKEAAVKVWESGQSKYLAAYLIGDDLSQNKQQCDLLSEIQGCTQQLLPEHMRPTQWMFIDKLPLNSSGKLDRKQLPQPQIRSRDQYQSAQTELQQRLVNIWQNVLGIERIGIEDNYFDLGGDSILSIQVVSQAKQAGLQFRVEDLILNQNIVELAKVVKQLTPQQAMETQDSQSSRAGLSELQQFPLTATQQGMLYHALYEQDRAIYTQQVELTLDAGRPESFAKDLFAQAWLSVFNSQQALQTRFIWQQSRSAYQQAVQLTDSDWQRCWQQMDWRKLTLEQQEETFKQLKTAQQQQGFELSEAPLSRFYLLQLSPVRYRLLWTYHHLLIDGWSLPIVLEAVSTAYQALLQGQAIATSESRPFSDYVYWLQEQDGETAEQYWQAEWAGLDEINKLVSKTAAKNPSQVANQQTDEVRDNSATYAVVQQVLETNLSRQLSDFVQQQRLTLATVMQAAWALLLNRLCSSSGNSREVFGITVSGRPAQLSGVDKMVGLFINTIPAIVPIEQNHYLKDWLQEILSQGFAREAHSYIPLSRIAELSALGGAQQLLQSLLVVENYPLKSDSLATDPDASDANTLRIIDAQFQEQTNYPLTLVVIPGERIEIKAMYQTAEFEPPFIDSVLAYLTRTIQFIVTSEDAKISDFQLLNKPQREQILNTWNATEYTYPALLIPQLLTQQAIQSAHATAISFQHQSLSYAELEQRSNCLAHYLIAQGVTTESLVAVSMQRSPELVISLLAILKSGGAYLPLDPDYPLQRLQFMLEDAEAKILLTEDDLQNRFGYFSGQIIKLQDQWQEITTYAQQPPEVKIHPSNLAYLIYTSGSTGRPKGVPNTHEALLNRILWMQRYFQIGAADCVLQKTPYSFDVSVWEFFWPLITGAQLTVAKPGGHKDSEYLVALIQQQQVTTIHFVPSMLQAFMSDDKVQECSSLQRIICSGEALPGDLAAKVQQRLKARLYNLYGPTEAAIDVSVWACDAHDTASERNPALETTVPIGYPIDNLQLYILDQQLQPLPCGVAGDLYIGGIGLARGYYKRPALTAEKFMLNPFVPGERMYKTGDIACFLPDGAIEYLGRSDNQIKLRGLRIETGEIEARLKQLDGIEDAVVKLCASDKSNYLVAYLLTPNLKTQNAVVIPGQEEIRQALLEDLPDYMCPAQMVYLEEFPLSSNGKLDYRALPQPDKQSESVYQAAENAIQAQLVEIWQTVLAVTPIGIQDNYFDLGGDSILSIQIVAKAKQAGIVIDLKTLIDTQTIAALAAQAQVKPVIEAEQEPIKGGYPATPIQCYFFDQVNIDKHHFNQSVLLETSQQLDVTALHDAFAAVLKQHDNLRLRFSSDASITSQKLEILALEEVQVELHHYRLSANEELETVIQQQSQVAQTSLQPEQGKLLQAVWFDTLDIPQSTQSYLLIVIHHMVIDGVSWRILTEDLHSAYMQRSAGQKVQLAAKTTAYKYWAERLQRWAQEPQVLEEGKNYWCQQAKIPCLELPIDKIINADIAITRASTRRHSKQFTHAQTQSLLAAPRALAAGVEEVLLAALLATMRDWMHTEQNLSGAGTGKNVVVADPQNKIALRIELEGHGREELFADVDLSRTVGWFTSLFPLVINDIAVSDTHLTILSKVKLAMQQLPTRGLNHAVYRYLSPAQSGQAELMQMPQAQLRFNYLGRFANAQQDAVFSGRSELNYAEDLSPRQLFDQLMDINCAIYDEQLRIDWRYSKHHYAESRIQQLLENFADALEHLLEEVEQPSTELELGLYSNAEMLALMQTQYSQGIDFIYPLSPLQQGILSHAVYAQQSESYLQQVTWYFDGDLDIPAWKQAWQILLNQHAILRTAFNWDKHGKPWQVVLHELTPIWLEQNYSKLDSETGQQLLHSFILEDRNKAFDVKHPPLIRLSLIALQNHEYFFLCSYHHVLLDGWSLPKLLEDLFDIYTALISAEQVQLKPRRPFKDYIAWLAEQDQQPLERFWQQQLAGFASPTKLAIDLENELSDSLLDHIQLQYQELELNFDAQLSARISTFARNNRITLNAILQGAWALLLSHYSGSRDILFGATVAGRPADLVAVDEMLGLFINTLPVRVKIDPQQSVHEFLQKLLSDNLQREPFAYAQLAEIQRYTDLKGGDVLFDSLFIFENYPMEGVLEGGSQQLQINRFQVFERTDLPLTILLTPGEQIQIKISYQQSRYRQVAINALMGHYQNILERLLLGSEQAIGNIPLCSQTEQQRLIQNYNPPDQEAYDLSQLNLAACLQHQAQLTPQNIAVEFQEQALTYAELHRQADVLAYALVAMGAGPEKIIAICMPRCTQMLVALLAVLKSGAAYLPLDPGFPAQRLIYMLEDAQAIAILKKGELPFSSQLMTLDIDELLEAQKDSSAVKNSLSIAPIDPDNLAYVIYTSGSTGKPKGVQVRHKNIVNFIKSMAYQPGIQAHDRLLAVTTISFDIAALELYLPLFCGARVVIADAMQVAEGFQLKDLLERYAITMMQATPATWRLLMATDWQANDGFKILCGGEALSAVLAAQLQQRAGQVWNLYGPTETAVWSMRWRLPKIVDDSHSIKLGEPLANTQIYILDDRMQAQPLGIPGELMIAGEGLARGYKDRFGLTAERFIPNPYGAPGALMYRTGDLVRRNFDGQIEYLSRRDFQTKVRGYRIELGEIETALEQLLSIQQAVVSVYKDHHDEARLVAYYRAQTKTIESFSEREVRKQLAQSLPTYMIPSDFIGVEKFVLTGSGKVDRKALPKPELRQAQAMDSIVKPQSQLQQSLSEIWTEVLQRSDFGIQDNFFDIGGHSLLLMQVWQLLTSRIDNLPANMQAVELFRYPTIAKLAERLSENAKKSESAAVDKARNRAQQQKIKQHQKRTRRRAMRSK